MKLVSSKEAAAILGLSLQGIHYRIKKGQLKSEKKDGKIFVYIDEKDTKISKEVLNNFQPSVVDNQKALIQSKDDQIALLQKTIKLMRKQYKNEIVRLEQNQDKIFTIFQSEVDLLKSAFNEMKTIYQIENKPKSETKSNIKSSIYFTIKDFFLYMQDHNKTNKEIKQIIIDKIKLGDKRFIYDKNKNKLTILKDKFLDII